MVLARIFHSLNRPDKLFQLAQKVVEANAVWVFLAIFLLSWLKNNYPAGVF
jgi:hypothetical protein